ncbi:hypothetical protein AUR64_10245 [Haloprofundus marisrubri]|uniref:Uncharacterized protein n=1 Tax=Haloprofundus marisrubri TaxID=1514971 RepID=A0A0W1R982_9EURY|nr:DUF5793 family protein [Haloprofundus marisrubri]KTG09981.1 hypothetical protein AUR64_10245 [Haloprofundus marisrubri]
MRRDYFELAVEHIDWVETDDAPEKPTVKIDFYGPAELLQQRLSDVDGALLDAKQTDVAFRLQEPLDENPEAPGVVSVTNRITGDFVLELNEDADDVLKFIRAAREYGEASGDDDGQYRVELYIEGEPLVTYEKTTFLVYNADGDLLRRQSLIPSGVEL